MRWEVGPVVAIGLAALLVAATSGRAQEAVGAPVKVATAQEALAGRAAVDRDGAGARAPSAGLAAAAGEAAKAAPEREAEQAEEVAALEKSEAADPAPVTRPVLPQKHVRAKPAGPTLVARIDLSSQRMHVTANGKPVGSWKISSGRRGYDTPPGSFRPKWISRMHYSRKYYNSPMPYSVFFNGGIATHGTSAVSRLGQPASHGCIRLTTANARTFYNLVRTHGKSSTRIVVTGSAPHGHYASRKPSRSRSTAANAFHAEARAERRNANGGRRMSVSEYERRYRDRVRRYQRQRLRVWPGDRY